LCCSFSNKIIVVPSIVSVPFVFVADVIVDDGVYHLLHASAVRRPPSASYYYFYYYYFIADVLLFFDVITVVLFSCF